MSWLYTIIFAGLMLSSDGGSLPVTTSNNNYTASKTITIPLADETEKFEQIYPLNAGGRVSVSNVNGSITINVWDKNEVKLEYVKTADDREALNDISVRISAQPDFLDIETDFDKTYRSLKNNNYQGRSYRRLDVEYRLTVPRGAVLNEIEAVNGSVTITGASNVTKASAVNGEVRAVNLRGTANLSTVNGTVVADFDQLQAGGKISLETVNGTVDLMIPSDANATIKADTVNGKISNDFGLPVRKGEYVGSDLHGKVGTGDVQIRLSSVNGALSVKRKNDGRNLNPAINLLNMKSEDGWDDEDEAENSSIKAPKPPKPPKAPKAPRITVYPNPPSPPNPPIEIDGEAIRKSVEDAMKQAEKEIERMGPDLERKYLEALRQADTLNSEEMQTRMKDMQTRYKDALARLGDGYFIVGSPAIEKKSGSFVVKGKPKVSVEARNCAVSVRGWDKSEVSYSIIKVSRGTQKSLEKDSTVSIKNSDSEVSIKVSEDATTRDGGFYEDLTKTRIEVFVPKKSDLNIITNGEIRLEGVSGEIDLQGSENSINVRDSDGKLSVKTVDGRIRVIGFRGAFDGKTTDGAMNLEGDFQKFSAETVDGTIVLTLPENANVDIESNRKDIVGEGVSLNYQGDGRSTSKWKVGSGGTNHLLYTTADGRIFVRTANALKTN